MLNAQNLNQDASVSQLGGRASEAATGDPHDTFKKALQHIDSNAATSALLLALREQGADPELIEKLIKQQEADEERKL